MNSKGLEKVIKINQIRNNLEALGYVKTRIEFEKEVIQKMVEARQLLDRP